jgi:hypothetical protein
MNQRQDKNLIRNKVRHTEYYSEAESEESDSRNERGGLTKGKKKSRQRQENSLGELTKNFINYIKQKGDTQININDVVKKLKVKKRRIYDITNVLEGKIFYFHNLF